jgi:hypothetical protein
MLRVLGGLARRDLSAGRPPTSNVATDAPEAEVLRRRRGRSSGDTHSHALDEGWSRRSARGDFAYCGLIGPRAKRRQLELSPCGARTPRERLRRSPARSGFLGRRQGAGGDRHCVAAELPRCPDARPAERFE